MTDGERRALLATVEGDIARLESELVNLKGIRTYLVGSLAPAVAPTVSAASPGSSPTLPVAPAPLARTSPRWWEQIERVLRAAGEDTPMRAPEIAVALVRDLAVAPREGRGLEKKCYTVMTRRPDLFVNLGDGKWSLAEYYPGLAATQLEKARAARGNTETEDADEEAA